MSNKIKNHMKRIISFTIKSPIYSLLIPFMSIALVLQCFELTFCLRRMDLHTLILLAAFPIFISFILYFFCEQMVFSMF